MTKPALVDKKSILVNFFACTDEKSSIEKMILIFDWIQNFRDRNFRRSFIDYFQKGLFEFLKKYPSKVLFKIILL